jgi:hypothetical protein
VTGMREELCRTREAVGGKAILLEGGTRVSHHQLRMQPSDTPS